ncbi:GIY-YIG nuclease family protein [Microseira wollei]|uniref:XRE family transcriptional regulator n=1 Tax=Microseira wollei NIES-4236 TaxID=2530354 RepID=A0AAV3XI42_9CYAN|nr:GIY-YIG nuclease family protein [Microseira wollei]GET42602.1 XRE family transcriptional regulator [Microseira wollei NIES-4236]
MIISEINPLTLPSLPLAGRRQLPDCSAIYFVMHGDRVLYIGKTINLVQRWATHHRWWQLKEMEGDIRIAWLECSDIDVLLKVEAALIKQFQPELNMKRNRRLKPPTSRFVFALPKEVQKPLEKWAQEEYRSTPNLIATILINAIREHEQKQSPPPEGKGD